MQVRQAAEGQRRVPRGPSVGAQRAVTFSLTNQRAAFGAQQLGGSKGPMGCPRFFFHFSRRLIGPLAELLGAGVLSRMRGVNFFGEGIRPSGSVPGNSSPPKEKYRPPPERNKRHTRSGVVGSGHGPFVTATRRAKDTQQNVVHKDQ
eukprot:gene2263-biopygen2206